METPTEHEGFTLFSKMANSLAIIAEATQTSEEKAHKKFLEDLDRAVEIQNADI